MNFPPFIVYGLPRSRTFWLSHFLSYSDFQCYHEHCQFMRLIEDMKSALSMNNTGYSETAASPAWRLIQHYRPDIKTVVVRRPVEDVVNSLMNIDLTGVATFDPTLLVKSMCNLNRYLDQIEANVPGALSVRYEDLKTEETCARVFEHCLPYRFDPSWWREFNAINLQVNHRALMRFRFAHRPQIDAFKLAAKNELRRLANAGAFV